jgi:hypothetical protein
MGFSPICADVNLLRSDRIEEIQEWVKQLGVNPSDVRPKIVIDMGEQGYRLHLSRFVRNSAGRRILDIALGEVVSEPLVIDLGTEQTWPAWLAEAARCQKP